VTIPISLKTIFARETTAFTLGVTGGLEEGEYQLEGSFVDAETGASASITKSTFTASAMTPREPDQFTFALATATPGPSEDDAQFATIESTIRNIGDPATGVQLSLIAMLDGEEVERFPISQSLSLPTGETPITTRYVPATGFTTGTWSFELVLETVSGSGAAVVVARAAIEETVVIP
jgi:hypothetical protein